MNAFTKTLQKHSHSSLRTAFENCNNHPNIIPYDRTTLGRWLKGSLPNRRDYVLLLAETLNDMEIIDSWDSLQNGSDISNVRNLVSRFRGLPLHHQEKAYEEIRDELLKSSPTLRSNYHVRFDLNDAAIDNYFEMGLTVSYTGELPANALIMFSRSYEKHRGKFAIENCLFRDYIDADAKTYDSFFEMDQFARQYITFTDLSKPKATETLEADQIKPGVFRFSTPHLSNGRIKLNIKYPFKVDTRLFEVTTEHHPVFGPFEVTFVLNSKITSHPACKVLLGKSLNYSSRILRGREINVSLGQGEQYTDNSSVLFSWLENS